MPDQSTAQRVGANVRAEMARRNLSQQSMSQKVNLSQQALSRRMTGQIAFSVDELADIAVALDVTLTDLIGTPVPVEASA